MLEPRKADIPALFLVLVVLPVVLYIILGKWNEAAKRKPKVNIVFAEPFEESFRVEPMAAASAVPLVVPPPISPIRECARCRGPSTTRCSRCKSVRYCSGKCQIIHWRQGHKEECQPPGYTDSFSLYGSTEEIDPRMDYGHGDSLSLGKRDTNGVGVGSGYNVPARDVRNYSEEVASKNSTPHRHSNNGSNDATPHIHSNNGSNAAANLESVRLSQSAKPMSRTGREHVHRAKLRKGNGSDDPGAGMGASTSAHESDGAASIGLMKTMGPKKFSKTSKQDVGMGIHGFKKVKVLFPFEEFTRFFKLEVSNLAPRGLQNCGNSCYANAVLQCLTCTKPLVAYLLSRMHSRACYRKNWCLMCELEQHVMTLKEAGGPLSPSKILSHMRGINCQIGDGSQEDAHEFLRLLVASMQSICLEEAGGENQIHPILQETTFVQQTFGGRLRSMVVCLRCKHESERYENIMDLTLEIYGWVESLEDALTQFTTPEDLDGENMYRCGRCASYVRARKQLSIDEAPNILTIVLKRFQEGNYGKINKCITFPEMLDMVPFMTGTNDIPPLYMLYGVVVHVDTLNASFSGHYVSYVKDLQGNWFRIDDSVVQPVPTSQVMSEGAYILFYMRSFPRPPRAYIRKAAKHHAAKASKPCGPKAQRTNKFTDSVETYFEPNIREFSDATSSDWSLFTSSDDASFSSESTRDSFSTADYSDTCHADPFSSMFSTRDRDQPSQRTVSCRMFSGSQPVTRYISEETGYILDSDNSLNPLDEIHTRGYTRQVSAPFNEAYLSDNNGYQSFVNYESYPSDGFVQTFSNFHL